MKQRKIIVVMLLLLCALPGCIQQSVGEAQVDFCQALDGYRDAEAKLTH